MSGPVPARVDGTAKAALLCLIDDAVDAGWTLSRACAALELDRRRAWRCQQRRAGGGLDDARPGGNPIHGLLEWIVDVVSRKWISTHLTANPDSVAARVLFSRGLDNEGLLTDELRARLAADETRRFMALCSIAQHFGRPSNPTDQAWIESLWGHVKRERPHLTTITDPATLAAELERVRNRHNSVRLHEAIGHVTPNDEHDGRGDTIRAARTDGTRTADQQRRA